MGKYIVLAMTNGNEINYDPHFRYGFQFLDDDYNDDGGKQSNLPPFILYISYSSTFYYYINIIYSYMYVLNNRRCVTVKEPFGNLLADCIAKRDSNTTTAKPIQDFYGFARCEMCVGRFLKR